METPAPYLAKSVDIPESNGLGYRKRADLWRQLTAHLIGLATVLWWIWFKESPPK